MIDSFEKAGAFGNDFIDSGLKSLAALSKGAQVIADDATEFVKKSYANGNVVLEKLAAAESPETAYEIQSAYCRSAYENFVAEVARVGERYVELARDAYKPFERAAANAR